MNSALPRTSLLAFCLPAIFQNFMHGPAGALLQGIYAKHWGLSLAALGSAVLLARVFDAVTDPLIGYLCDRGQEKFGTRKPWLAAGGLISLIGIWFLYRPPADVGILWFTGWFMVAYLGWTMIEIPYRSWAMELSCDYVQRTRVMTWVAVATAIGGIAFYLVPFAQQALGQVSSTEIGPDTLAAAAVVSVVGLSLSIALALRYTPDAVTFIAAKRDSLRQVLSSIFHNGPLIYVTALFLVMGVTSGMGGGLLYLYVDVYLGLGPQLAGLMILASPVLILSTPLWGWACARFEKHRTLAVAVAVQALCAFGYAFVPTGGQGFGLLLALLLTGVCMQAAGLVAFPAMMGDVADHGRLKFGHDRAGVYFSFFTLMQKAVSGIGVMLGLSLAAAFGFDATVQEQSASGVLGMQLAVAYVPAVAALIAVPLLWRFPINRARQAEIRRQLEMQAA